MSSGLQGAARTSQVVGGDIALHSVTSYHSQASSARKKSGQTPPRQSSSRLRLSQFLPDRSSSSFRQGRLFHDVSDDAASAGAAFDDHLSHHGSQTTAKSAWWTVHPFRGMIGDIKRRAPHYWGDWTDAWDYRVVPATIYMYFAKYVKFSLLN